VAQDLVIQDGCGLSKMDEAHNQLTGNDHA
jgi:hypothetical protein